MIKQIGTTGVYVSDQDKAIEFYVDVLGFEKRDDQPMGEGARWIEVAPPGAESRLVLSLPSDEEGRQRVGTFVGIVFETDDIEATHRELSTRGVGFTEPPTLQPWGTMAQFVDQDGNGFVLVQR